MESPPGTGCGAQGDGMKHKEQLWGPFLLSHTCNKSCGLQSGPASTPNAPRALGTPPRLLGTPCGQATRPQSRCPHSLPRAALLRRPLAAPRGGISVSPPVSPKPCSSPSVTAAAPRAGGGPGRSSQAFPPEGAQMSPNPPGHVRPSSWRRGAGTWVAPWGLAPRCHPFLGLCHQKKKPCQLPQTLSSPMAREKTHVFSPLRAWSIPKFPHCFFGGSPNPNHQ